MTIEAPQCERCRVPMERGYMIDHSHGVTYPMAWVAGLVRWSKWWGLRVKRKEKIPVASFRCPQCGRLESYTQPGPWPS